MLRLLVICLGVLTFAVTGALAQDSYRLREGDRLTVSVLEDPGLNSTVLVRPDGKISLPLVGTIQAEGQTPEQVQAAIRRALAPSFVEPPTVTVALSSVGTQDTLPLVFVLGEVGRPGAVPIEDGRALDILQALALAGGPGPFAATHRIQIRRKDRDGGDALIIFDYDRVLDGDVPILSVPLADGDVVVVPERGLFE